VKHSGSIRRRVRQLGRSVPGREGPRIASRSGTAYTGPELTSGPGFSLPIGQQQLRCPVPMSVPSPSALISYLIPLERKTRMGALRRDSNE
jgi:hypothetical protein